MAKFNIEAILKGAKAVLDAAEQLAPVAQQFGGPTVANVATMAISGIAIIENVLERAQGVKGAMSEQDETKLRNMLSDLQAVNDRLAGTIAES